MNKNDLLELINRIDNDIRNVNGISDSYGTNAVRMVTLPLIETLKEQRLRYIEELGQITLREMREPNSES